MKPAASRAGRPPGGCGQVPREPPHVRAQADNLISGALPGRSALQREPNAEALSSPARDHRFSQLSCRGSTGRAAPSATTTAARRPANHTTTPSPPPNIPRVVRARALFPADAATVATVKKTAGPPHISRRTRAAPFPRRGQRRRATPAKMRAVQQGQGGPALHDEREVPGGRGRRRCSAPAPTRQDFAAPVGGLITCLSLWSGRLLNDRANVRHHRSLARRRRFPLGHNSLGPTASGHRALRGALLALYGAS